MIARAEHICWSVRSRLAVHLAIAISETPTIRLRTYSLHIAFEMAMSETVRLDSRRAAASADHMTRQALGLSFSDSMTFVD